MRRTLAELRKYNLLLTLASVCLWVILSCTGSGGRSGVNGWGTDFYNDNPAVTDPTTTLVWAFPSNRCQTSGYTCPASWITAINAVGHSSQFPPWRYAAPVSVSADGLDYCARYGTVNGLTFSMPTLAQFQTALQNGLAAAATNIGADTSLFYATQTTGAGASSSWFKSVQLSNGAINLSAPSTAAAVICVSN